MEWQPIETAPKDGTDILASEVGARRKDAVIVFWGEDDGWCLDYGLPVTTLTHWMHLPEPPEGS